MSEHEQEVKLGACSRIAETIFIVSEIAIILLYSFLTNYEAGVGT
jgi:hypothetical protein